MNGFKIEDLTEPRMPTTLVELFKESTDVIRELIGRAVACGDAPEKIAVIIIEHQDELEGRTVQLSELREIHRNAPPVHTEADEVWATSTKLLIEQPPIPGMSLVLCVGMNSEWGVGYFLAGPSVSTNSPGGSA